MNLPYKNKITSISILYTHKCPIYCDHCCGNFSPKRKEKLTPKKVLDYFNDISSIKVKKICFTGGEPFLFFDELINLISKGKRMGFKISVISNGFWAVNEKETRKIMRLLSKNGLAAIKISADEFHQKFIPIDNILNILKISNKQIPLKTIISFTKTKDLNHLNLLHFFKKFRKLRLLVQPVIPVGRAKNKIKKEKVLYRKIDPKAKCPMPDLPTIDAYKQVYVCCNGILAGRNSIFHIGDTSKEELKDILLKFKENRLIHFLKTEGPFILVKELEKNKLRKRREIKTKKYVGVCDYCMKHLATYRKNDIEKALEKIYLK
ncbi:MAG: radical SAM protein [Candidatus Diapherotrites archaeon]